MKIIYIERDVTPSFPLSLSLKHANPVCACERAHESTPFHVGKAIVSLIVCFLLRVHCVREEVCMGVCTD